MPDWYSAELPPSYSRFKEIPVSENWFRVFEIGPDLYVLHEPRHYEGTIVNLVIGHDRAALIDTGCGIGNIRQVVQELTQKPVSVVNTHTHLDHLGGNRLFEEIMMFDHPRSRRMAEQGAGHAVVQNELLDDNLVVQPWPDDFDPDSFALPPFHVSRWVTGGDRIDLGGRDLEVICTPGEAEDHIALLDRTHRLLFCGDILLHGPVWTHLEGGSLLDLIASYHRLMMHIDAFDHLMPGHNEPWLDKGLLPETLAGAEEIVSGGASYQEVTDPWGRSLRKYDFGKFSILTRQEGALLEGD